MALFSISILYMFLVRPPRILNETCNPLFSFFFCKPTFQHFFVCFWNILNENVWCKIRESHEITAFCFRSLKLISESKCFFVITGITISYEGYIKELLYLLVGFFVTISLYIQTSKVYKFLVKLLSSAFILKRIFKKVLFYEWLVNVVIGILLTVSCSSKCRCKLAELSKISNWFIVKSIKCNNQIVFRFWRFCLRFFFKEIVDKAWLVKNVRWS